MAYGVGRGVVTNPVGALEGQAHAHGLGLLLLLLHLHIDGPVNVSVDVAIHVDGHLHVSVDGDLQCEDALAMAPGRSVEAQKKRNAEYLPIDVVVDGHFHDFFNRHRYILLNWDLHFNVSVYGVGHWLFYDVLNRILTKINLETRKQWSAIIRKRV